MMSNKAVALNSEKVVLSSGTAVRSLPFWSVHDRLIKTVLFMVSYALVSPMVSLLGVAPVHLEILLDCDTPTMALSFTLQGVGFFLGALLCATVLRGVDALLVFSGALVLLAVSCCCAPFCPSIASFLPVIMMMGIGVSVFNTEAQAYFLRLWSDHRLKGPVVQTLPAVWSLSSTLSPLIVTPFLAELSAPLALNQSSTHHNDTLLSAQAPLVWNDTPVSAPPLGNASLTPDGSTAMAPLINGSTATAPLVNTSAVDVQMIRYVFLIFGAPNLLPAVAFFVLYLVNRPPVLRSKAGCTALRSRPDSQSKPVAAGRVAATSRRRFYDKFVVALAAAFLFFLMFTDERAFFATFAVKHLGWPARRGTLVAMAFYGAMCAGRVIGVPLSYWLRPRTVLTLNLALIGAASALFLCTELNNDVIWGAAAALGYGVSTTFGALALMLSESVAVTGRVMACFIFGTSCGGVISPMVVGRLFVAYTPMSVGYVMVAAVIVDVVIFAALVAVTVVGAREAGVGGGVVEELGVGGSEGELGAEGGGVGELEALHVGGGEGGTEGGGGVDEGAESAGENEKVGGENGENLAEGEE